jgi:splicing factor 3A subunit 2
MLIKKKGRPGYKVTKQRDPDTKQQSLLFQIDYPEIMDNLTPRHRFMSAYEQRIEPPDKKFQYLLFAAEPYETIAFKVPSREIDKTDNKFWTHWNSEAKQFFLQLSFKCEREGMFIGQMSNQTVMLTQQMSTQQGYIINI